jgi:hypothetical protein
MRRAIDAPDVATVDLANVVAAAERERDGRASREAWDEPDAASGRC